MCIAGRGIRGRRTPANGARTIAEPLPGARLTYRQGAHKEVCYPRPTVLDTSPPVILQVAVPTPLRRLFDYLPAPGVDPSRLRPGCILRVPFGKREVTGVLLALARNSATPGEQLRAALGLVEDSPLLPPAALALCRWAANYYFHPPGEVYTAALPRWLREGKPLPREAWRLTARGHGLPEGALRRAPSQARALAALQRGAQLHSALREAGIASAALRELTRKGLIERCLSPQRNPTGRRRETGPSLAAEQSVAIEAVSLGQFQCHLLEGVTGSGKTEVYFQLIARCLDAGRQALVLIPEIGLTPQTLARFETRFATPIAILHSGLAEGRRLSAWEAARSGVAGIVIGTRSAVLTPLARPGLLVVDEEHDSAYKQQDGFRYSARDVAVKRAQIEGCPIVLGSATPSLETLRNARLGRYAHHRLKARRGGALPTLYTLDLRGKTVHAGLSDELLQAIEETVEVEQRQALLFLNRRGYAPTLQCHSCGWIAGCEHCDARLTVHLRRRALRCHHCAARKPLPVHCPACAGTTLLTQGLGTEQTEDFLRNRFKCPIHRVDSDAMRGAEAMQALLSIAQQEEPCIILGTQMLTKGHHFPALQLVGIIDADALLYSADFRGEERMAQLITQVGGRAGRERRGARVLIQPPKPEAEVFTLLKTASYSALAEKLLIEREARGLPPSGQLLLLRVDARQEAQAERFLRELRRAVDARLPGETRCFGPLPSSMARRAGRFRWQLWCLSPTRRSSHQAARQLVAAASEQSKPRDLNWFIDVDPIDMQ